MCLLQLTRPVGGVVFSGAVGYALLGCLGNAVVKLFDNVVHVPPFYFNISCQLVGAFAEQAPLCLLVVPTRVLWLSWCFSTHGEDNWAMVTTSELFFYFSADLTVDVIGAESQVWSCGGAPAAGVEGWCIRGVVDKNEVVFILPSFNFFSSVVNVVISPTLGPAVEVSSDEEAAVWDLDCVKGQHLVIGAVIIDDVGRAVLDDYFDFYVLGFTGEFLDFGGVDVVSYQCHYSSLCSPLSSIGKHLVASDLKWLPLLQMCFLNTADVDTVFVKEVFKFFLLVADPFCIPLHDVDVGGLPDLSGLLASRSPCLSPGSTGQDEGTSSS